MNVSAKSSTKTSRAWPTTFLSALPRRLGLSAPLLFVLLAIPSFAQTAPAPPARVIAPIPPALLTGKTVFLSNAGADSGLFPEPFTGDPDRGYAQFYAALRAWGRYTLVDDPANADLIFELQLAAPNGPANANKQKGASDPLPMFRLVIFEAKTHYILWALTESINPAILQKTHDYNFDLALSSLTIDLKRLVSHTPQPAPAP